MKIKIFKWSVKLDVTSNYLKCICGCTTFNNDDGFITCMKCKEVLGFCD